MANEAIPAYRPGADVTVIASGAIVGKTFVNISAALDVVAGTPATAVTATAAGLTIGVASRDAASGSKVGIIRGPGIIVPVTAGGAIAVGAEVEVGAGGKAVAFSAGVKRGRAWSAGTNNNDVYVELY